MSVRRTAVAWTAVLCAMASPSALRAQSTEAAATALFDEGRKLMTQHRYAEACPKLGESQRLAPSGGTLLNLAECYERSGQTASAWVTWKNAAARASAVGKSDVESKALSRAAVLEPALARLAIVVAPESDVAGLEVERDGVAVGRAEFGVAIPVDPGAHLIEATAPRKKKTSVRVEVLPKQSDARVTLVLEPDLEASPPPTAAPIEATRPPTHALPLDEEPTHSPGGTQRTMGIVAVGVGVAGVAVGSIFGLVAKSKNEEALLPENCRTRNVCTAHGLSLTSEAKDAAMASNIAFGVGGAALVGGAIVWLTAPRDPGRAEAARIRFVPALARTSATVSLEGTW